MYISKVKILVVFLIIVSILYKSNIENKISDDINGFSSRRYLYNNTEFPSFPNDYSTEEYAKMYLQNFVNILQNDINTNVSNYVEENYYKDKILNEKEAFIKNMRVNIIMVNPISNYQNIEHITEFVGIGGHRTLAWCYGNGKGFRLP